MMCLFWCGMRRFLNTDVRGRANWPGLRGRFWRGTSKLKTRVVRFCFKGDPPQLKSYVAFSRAWKVVLFCFLWLLGFIGKNKQASPSSSVVLSCHFWCITSPAQLLMRWPWWKSGVMKFGCPPFRCFASARLVLRYYRAFGLIFGYGSLPLVFVQDVCSSFPFTTPKTWVAGEWKRAKNGISAG